MEFSELSIKGIWLIKPRRFEDPRGYFMESFKKEEFLSRIGPVEFLQDNESFSSRGVLRGLHFQKGEFAQAKLIRVTRGRILDVVVDIRAGSPTLGKHLAVELSQENSLQLFMPRGMAHGFVVLSDTAQIQYKVDNPYAPLSEATLRYDDPAQGIDWVLPEKELILSDKDRRGMPLDSIELYSL